MPDNPPLPNLPQEIITNILSRLPVKSLLLFKCVSKSWFSWISNPHFAKLQLLQMKQNNTLTHRVFMNTNQSFDPEAYSDDYETATIVEHYPFDNVADLSFVGSCNGLICGARDYRLEELVVFNPTTKQVRQIPTAGFTEKGRYFCGFGYDSKIDDYKIVRGVIFSFYDDGFCIESFNLKGNSWRAIQTKHWCGDSFDEEGVLLGDLFDGKGVFLNGVLHWPTGKGYGIVRFDFVEERFLDTMPIPSHINYDGNLMVIDGCLCLYTLRSETFSAWKLMNYGDQNSWTRVYQISTNTFPEYCSRFLYVTKNGHLLFDIDTDYLILYNPKDEGTKQIGDEAEGDVEKTVYIESLIPPNTAD